MRISPTWRRIVSRVRCFLGDHEQILDPVPPTDDPPAPARIRLRCLHCSAVTPGWEQGTPAYRRTYDAGNLSLVNPRLQTALADAEPVAVGETRRKNLVTFGVAKRRRTR